MPQKRYLMTPGPTPVPPAVLAAMSLPIVHHRTPGFRAMFEKLLASLQEIYRTASDVLLFTSSGTGGMDSAVSNTCSPGDRVLVVSAGNFGERWLSIAAAYGCEVQELRYPWGEVPSPDDVGGEARGDRRRARGLPDSLGDVDRRRHRPAGNGGPDPAFRCTGRGRCDLEPRRSPLRDGCVGPGRRRLGLAESAHDTARGWRSPPFPRPRSRLRPTRRRRGSTSTGRRPSSHSTRTRR